MAARRWLSRSVLQVWDLQRSAKTRDQRDRVHQTFGTPYYLQNRDRRTRYREWEIRRLARVLRALQRKLDGPLRTPTEVKRAVDRCRVILESTGIPVDGECVRCGFVMLRRRQKRCPVCHLTEQDGGYVIRTPHPWARRRRRRFPGLAPEQAPEVGSEP